MWYTPEEIDILYDFTKEKEAGLDFGSPATIYKTYLGGVDAGWSEDCVHNYFDSDWKTLSQSHKEEFKKRACSCRSMSFALLTHEGFREMSKGIAAYHSKQGEILYIRTQRHGSLNLLGMTKNKARKHIKDFFLRLDNTLRDSRIYLVDFRYIQADKIDSLYSQIVQRVEVGSSEEQHTKDVKRFEGNGGFGKLLAFLGIEVGAKVGLNRENALSKKVMYELSHVQKCTLIYETLVKSQQVSLLKHDISHRKASKSFVRFTSSVKTITPAHLLHKGVVWMPSVSFRIQGKVAGWTLEMICFAKYFMTSPNFIAVLEDGGNFETEGFGSILKLDEKRKKIIVSPVALWGPYY
jgi:hypothetical protein